jgi:hypothetical protein
MKQKCGKRFKMMNKRPKCMKKQENETFLACCQENIEKCQKGRK